MPTIDESLAKLREHIAAGRLEQAQWGIQKLLTRHPDHQGALVLAALLQHRRGETQTAINLLRQAVRRFPNSAYLKAELGQALFVSGNATDAETELRQALEIDASNEDALSFLTRILMARGQWEDSEPLLDRLRQIAPGNSEVWSRIGCCAQSQGLLDVADAALQKSMALDANYTFPASNRALLSNYRDDLTAAEIFAIHRDWPARHAPVQAQLPPRISRKPGRPRIGYVSADFRAHSVTTFLAPVLKHHDRSALEITCYASVGTEDEITRSIRRMSERWQNIRKLDDASAARMIRSDDIDILVDLAGHSGESRLAVFALKPAPVQISWLGYPNTTGLPQMDYRITDSIADPTEASQAWHSEKLLRMPETFFCYAGPRLAVEPGNSQPPCARRDDGMITFAAPTVVQKIRPKMIHAWAKILDRLPTSRLLVNAQGADTQKAREWIVREFSHAGLADLSRVELRGSVGFFQYLRSHDEWDVALDTFPFNGHTTTCHCLWMGVPIVTLAGQMHAGRMGASVLHALQLDDCIANNHEEYVAIAVKLAADVGRRRELRATLRDRMLASPMMDAVKFTRNLEAIYFQLFGQMFGQIQG